MKTVFVDMDGVLADFEKQMNKLRGGPWDPAPDPPEMFEPGFFRSLPVVPGADWAMELFREADEKNLIRVYIASKPVRNGHCAGEKILWVEEHFPWLWRRMLLVCDKRLLRGDFLIDDDHEDRWHKTFEGTFIKFDKADPYGSWERAVTKVFYP
jgi:5'(3')-deoxyribonucleotidase